MKNIVIKLLKKYREIILYGLVGGGTTVINMGSYLLFTKTFGIQYLISNIMAWIAGFLFAFLANKIWVFRSKSFQKQLVIKEVVSFFSARITTGLLDMLLLFTFVHFIGLSDTLAKVIDIVISTILNYILSKFWVFKKTKSDTVQANLIKAD